MQYLLSFCLFYQFCIGNSNETYHSDYAMFTQKNSDSAKVKKLDSIKTVVSVELSAPVKKKQHGKNALISKKN
jgi:hypothetical protein